jgi:hypothetical protein
VNTGPGKVLLSKELVMGWYPTEAVCTLYTITGVLIDLNKGFEECDLGVTCLTCWHLIPPKATAPGLFGWFGQI